MDLNGRAAIVTGGAGGLGSATVRRLIAAGMGVVVFDRDVERADALAAELGEQAVSASGDITDDGAIQGAIEAAVALGEIAVLVNVAGGGVGGGRLVARDGSPHDYDSFTTTLEMNATGTFNASRHIASAMGANEPDVDGQRGVIINTASIAGIEGRAGQVAYAAAKAAILGMTLPMARDLAPMGIRVNAIAPGTMGTPLMVASLPHMKTDPTAGIVFPKRMGHPEEFAQLVESIAANSYMNGENIRLDGALRFQP
jgi:NAD(P)-dependent dehydrogenase (short-subunit alcohol dehydrogenase family)